MAKNANRKQLKYLELLKQLKEKYKQVKFVTLSISAIGFFDKTSSGFNDMMKDLQIYTTQMSFVIRKIITIAIRTLTIYFVGIINSGIIRSS